MKRVIAIVILAPLAVLLIALAVANRHPVLLSLDPFNGDAPAAAIAMPLYIVVFLSMALGVLLGGIGAWLGQGRWRREARSLKREARATRRDGEGLRSVGPSGQATTLPAVRRGAA